ncbi:hypothetical protein D3C80_1607600 [compost metagenome]
MSGEFGRAALLQGFSRDHVHGGDRVEARPVGDACAGHDDVVDDGGFGGGLLGGGGAGDQQGGAGGCQEQGGTIGERSGHLERSAFLIGRKESRRAVEQRRWNSASVTVVVKGGGGPTLVDQRRAGHRAGRATGR